MWGLLLCGLISSIFRWANQYTTDQIIRKAELRFITPALECAHHEPTGRHLSRVDDSIDSL